MTAPAALPETIRAHVHEDAINRVTRFFTSSSTETLGELLQNARRAHATKVEVTVKDGTVTVKDDGDGIHNPEAILGFGHADWDAGTTGNEDPAGMGFYSLSNYEGVSVHSRIKATGQAWRVELSTDHFLGKSPATVQRLEDDSRHGTTITFQDEHAKTDHVASAARYFPLPVNCNGEQMPRHDFLRDAAYTAEWEGIRIGVFKNAHRYLHPSYDQINFHGITASGADLPSITDIDGERWRTLADVQECPQLMLALPARRQVIQNSFLEELQHQCLRAIYQAVLEDPAHIDLGYEDYTQAHRMGIPVEEAKPLLQEWEADKTHEPNPYYRKMGKRKPSDDALIVYQSGTPSCDQQILARAIDRHGSAGRFMFGNKHLKGYGWYDSLACINHFAATAATGGEETVILDQDGHRPGTEAEEGRPDTITLDLYFTQKGGPSTIRLEADVAFGTQEVYSPENPNLLVTRTSDITVRDLTALLMDSFFYPSDDPESDSFETQKEYWEEELTKVATEFLLSDEEAMRAAIADATARHVRYHLRPGYEADIRIARSSQPEVTIKRVEGHE